ncbi:unnamed protein product [Cyclocybe aegerita]|uniref:Uncharacterized protein n=1 Tax=Cyclocybe aegerita TaxID=1973307 RepID=A0A8S0WUW5_CYCAE|nr:unnamed protein product [Cyclocybe aegerita]
MSNHPHAPSLPFSSRKPDGADFELDEKWKAQLKKRIEGSFQSMVRDAKDNYQARIRKGSISAEARTRVEAEYRQEMTTVKELATEQYQYEINRERDQRRLTATMPFIRHNDANPSNDEQASSLASQHKPDTTDFEPDEEWKAQLKKRIEGGLQSMVQDAKARMPDKTKRHITVETRLRLEAEYK